MSVIWTSSTSSFFFCPFVEDASGQFCFFNDFVVHAKTLKTKLNWAMQGLSMPLSQNFGKASFQMKALCRAFVNSSFIRVRNRWIRTHLRQKDMKKRAFSRQNANFVFVEDSLSPICVRQRILSAFFPLWKVVTPSWHNEWAILLFSVLDWK